MNIVIREATVEDAKTISFIGVTSWKSAYNGIVFLPGQLFQKLPYLPVREMKSIMSIKTERRMTSHY